MKCVGVRITLGLKFDGPLPWVQSDALGELAVGPLGFLSLLEARLGIPGTDSSFTPRLIQYLACVDLSHHPDRFYHASYEADPFSVARTLLQWRDEWYLAGWNGTFTDAVPQRLSDMAAIEHHAAQAVDAGLGQRVQRVLGLLRDNPTGIEHIELRDALDDFPWLWRELIQAVGASITALSVPKPSPREDTDLGRMQRHLLDPRTSVSVFTGDGTLRVIEGEAPYETAPIVAELSQRWLVEAHGVTVAVLAERRGGIIDDAFEAAGAPRPGYQELSPWRPIFQVLPLVCELLWTPLNATALLQLLSHSVGPIPKRIREPLARVVAESPGVGGARWEEAIATCLENEPVDTRQKLLEDIRYWFEPLAFDPNRGVDSTTLTQRAQRVGTWLLGVRERSDDSFRETLYSIALNQVVEFEKAIDRLNAHGWDRLSRDQVLRLIDDVRGTGSPVVDREAEIIADRTSVLRAEHAGVFGEPVEHLVWWDCQASDRVQRWPWSHGERVALEGQGVHLQSEDEQLRWLGAAWLRPLLSAKQDCLIVLHRDADRRHPIWEQIAGAFDALPISPVSDSSTLLELRAPLERLEHRSLPAKHRWWRLSAKTPVARRDNESYSSLDRFVHSPYQWLLHYAARLRPGSLVSVASGNVLKGNIAHRLVEDFLNANPDVPTIDRDRITRWVDEHIPGLLKHEGALLLELGEQTERERFIENVSNALAALVEHLQRADVRQVRMELHGEGTFAGGKINGSIDLLATRADGVEAVVDVKWGGREYRRTALQNGDYLQLATYAKLRQAAGGKPLPALSYFIVRDAHMLSLEHDFFPEAEIVVPASLENALEYWSRFESTWRWRREQFDRGFVEVTVTGTEPTVESVPDERCLEIHETSDTFNDFAVLTGWDSLS